MSNKGITRKGGHVHSAANAVPVSVSEEGGVTVKIALVNSPAIWGSIKAISFARTENPGRHETSNDHDGKGKAECHSQKSLKMGAVERAPTFFGRSARKLSIFHQSRSKTTQRQHEADHANEMQHIMVTG